MGRSSHERAGAAGPICTGRDVLTARWQPAPVTARRLRTAPAGQGGWAGSRTRRRVGARSQGARDGVQASTPPPRLQPLRPWAHPWPCCPPGLGTWSGAGPYPGLRGQTQVSAPEPAAARAGWATAPAACLPPAPCLTLVPGPVPSSAQARLCHGPDVNWAPARGRRGMELPSCTHPVAAPMTAPSAGGDGGAMAGRQEGTGHLGQPLCTMAAPVLGNPHGLQICAKAVPGAPSPAPASRSQHERVPPKPGARQPQRARQDAAHAHRHSHRHSPARGPQRVGAR